MSNALLNAAIVAAAAVVIVLVYGLATRAFVPRTDPIREDNPGQLLGDRIQVEIRNGVGESGLASTATHYLRSRGFDVVESGNHTTFGIDSSFVVDRIGNPQAAQRVAAALGLSMERVREDIREDYFLDVSVILGNDYLSLEPFVGSPAP